jgi:transposase-like protein
MEIRKVIYTTNAIESLNPSLSKMIKTKAVFPDEQSVFELLDMALSNIAKRWSRPTKKLEGCSLIFCYLVPSTV